ncbi:MAG: hypothetical protein IPH69_01640 [Bacteroidales bacterium]|nr:hypothetical protein [Bacteroidales bacterium]
MENSVNPKTEDKKVPQKQTGNLKKKVKDYFFDFFMLFLAVTLGFFVNNLSEDQSERKREKQYMESLINDLVSDTIQIREVNSSIKKQITGIDSLLLVLENPNRETFINDFYFFAIKYLNSATFFTISDRTISQLKSTGGLRLIRNIAISDSIVNYYSSSDNVKYNTGFCLDEFNKILNYEKEIMNFKYLRAYPIDSIQNQKNVELLINDPVKINQFYNQVIYYLSSLINYNILITDLNKEAVSLMNLVKENYNL